MAGDVLPDERPTTDHSGAGGGFRAAAQHPATRSAGTSLASGHGVSRAALIRARRRNSENSGQPKGKNELGPASRLAKSWLCVEFDCK